MKNEEYFDELYRRLIDILKHERLDWVVEEIASRSLTGKIAILTTEELKKLPRRKKQKTFSTDYTSKEKLKLLINAIEYAIMDNVEMEKEIVHFFSSQEDVLLTHKAKEVQFSSEDYSEYFTIVYQQNVTRRQRNAQELKEAIDKLKELVNDAN